MPSLLDRVKAGWHAFAAPLPRAVSVVTRVQPPPLPPSAPLQAWARRTVEKIRTASIGSRLRMLPYLDNHTEETQEIRDTYPTMLKEAIVKSGFLTKTLAVCAQTVQINPDDDTDPRQQEGAAFSRHCLQRIKGGVVSLGWNVLSGMIVRGWSVCDYTERIEWQGRFKGKTIPHLIKAKEGVRLDLDNYRNIIGVRSIRESQKVWPPDEFIITSYLGLDSNPFGMSDFRAAYRPYFIKNSVWQFRGLSLEKFSAGAYLKGTYTNEDQKHALEVALANAESSTWISVPPGVLVDVIDLAGRGTADFEAAIRDCDREMLIAIVGAYLQILEGQVSNGRGDTQIHQSTSELFQWLLSALLEQVLNEQLIPRWIEINYTDLIPPRASVGAVNDAALKPSLDIDQFFLGNGVKLSKKDRLAYYGREEASSPDDEMGPPPAPGGPPPPPAPPSAPSPPVPLVEGKQGRPFPRTRPARRTSA